MNEPRNHALWFGPLLAVFGFVSYYTIFSRWPVLRDVPWLNLGILLIATAVSWKGLRRARPAGGWRRAAGFLAVGLSLSLIGLLSFYCFDLSYGLPSADLALAVGKPVPAITLKDNRGRDVDIARDERTLLVFYRGHW